MVGAGVPPSSGGCAAPGATSAPTDRSWAPLANAQSRSAACRVQLGVTVLPIWVMSRVRPFRVAAPMKVFRAPVVYPFLMPIVPG